MLNYNVCDFSSHNCYVRVWNEDTTCRALPCAFKAPNRCLFFHLSHRNVYTLCKDEHSFHGY